MLGFEVSGGGRASDVLLQNVLHYSTALSDVGMDQ